MLGKLIGPEIEELIRAKQLDVLKATFAEMPPADLAEIIEDMEPESAAVAFRTLSRQQAGEVFAALPMDQQEELLVSLSSEQVGAILNSMAPDDRTQLLEELPGEATQRLLGLLSDEQRKVTVALLGYPEDSIGRLMTPNYIMVQPPWTVEQALKHIRDAYTSSETANVVYVVDDKLRLIDDLKLAQIVAAQPGQRIEELMDHSFVALRADDDQETAVETFKKYYRVALPVTDTRGILVGIVTVDDVLTVAETEATEDIQKLGGMQALAEPYITTPYWTLIRKRAPWLLILFFSGIMTVRVLHRFEDTIAKAAVLVSFLPLIIASGGNSGSQAATLIIRALAVGELTAADWWRVMRRELASGLVLGLGLGGVGFVTLGLTALLSDAPWTAHWMFVGLTIFLTLVGIVIWGSLIGSMLPLLLRKAGLDPAVSSTPFVATLVDVTGILLYFTVATVVLSGTLL